MYSFYENLPSTDDLSDWPYIRGGKIIKDDGINFKLFENNKINSNNYASYYENRKPIKDAPENFSFEYSYTLENELKLTHFFYNDDIFKKNIDNSLIVYELNYKEKRALFGNTILKVKKGFSISFFSFYYTVDFNNSVKDLLIMYKLFFTLEPKFIIMN